MLFRFVKRLSNPAVRLSQPADDTVYTCHDEAFLQAPRLTPFLSRKAI